MKKCLLLINLLLLCMTGCVTLKFGQSPPIPGPKITAWIPFWDWNRAMVTVRKNDDIISELMPFWYDMDSTGKLFPAQGIPEMREKGMLDGMNEKAFVDYCHRHQIKVLPLISNEFDKVRVHFMLTHPEIRQVHLDNIMNLVLNNDYDGIDIDYEGMMKEDRDLYSAFLKDLGDRLHVHNKLLSVAVHAKFSEPGGWDSNIAHDYKAIGRAVDHVRIMAYDQHWSGGVPGPISSIDWEEKIISFAVTVIPSKKIYLGFPIYGINWGKPKDQEAMYEDTMDLVHKYHSTVHWDTTSQENWFTYTDESTLSIRTVWFQNGRSFEPRWDLVKKYHLGGISFWRIGGEDPQIWRRIRTDEFVPPGHVQLWWY